MQSRVCLGLHDRSRVFGDKDFLWSLEDFAWSAAVVQINEKVQLGRGSGCGFTGVGGRETHTKCSWKNAAPGFQPLGYSWPELMMIYDSYRTFHPETSKPFTEEVCNIILTRYRW